MTTTTTTDSGPAEIRVVFSKRKDPALLLGRTLAQLVFLVIAGFFVIMFVRGMSAGRINWWLLVTAVALVPLGWARIRGRSIADVGPALVADRVLRLLRQREYRGGPHRRLPQDTAGTPKVQPRLPGLLKALEFESFEVGESRAEQGVVFDRTDGTVTIVLEVTGVTFPLQDTGTANAYAIGFQRLLDALARRDSPIQGIQNLERVIPDRAEASRREYRRRGNRGHWFAQEANELLLESEAGRDVSHTSLIAVRIDPRRTKSIKQQVTELGGRDTGAAALAFKVAAGLEHDLQSAGLKVLGILPPRAIAAHCRSALDPNSDEMVARRGGGLGDDAGGDEGMPSGSAPAAIEPSRLLPGTSYLWHNDQVSRTWWIEEYPRSAAGVPVGFLYPLLLRVPWRHSVSQLIMPLDRRQAAREINQDLSKADATNKLDRKWGRRKTRAKEREEADTDRREVDLSEGFSNHRVVTLVTATATSVKQLNLISADIESAMNTCGMEGYIWYVETDQAFVAGALPLGRGLL